MLYFISVKTSPPRSTRIPRVIAVVSMQSNYGPSVLRGIFTHIATHGEWGLEIIRSAADFTAETVSEALQHRADGFILALNEGCQMAYRALVACDIPFVTVETYSDILSTRTSNATHFRIDNASIGRDAARNFLRQGRYTSFGFVPPRNEQPWSLARAEGFTRELAKHRRQASVFPCRHANSAVERRGDLAKWLRRLDRPTAVLAADDSVALDVIQASRSARLKIPDDIAVLGVDDDFFVCENIRPTLSSIRPAFAEAGRQAADALERLMHGRTQPTTVRTAVVRGRNEIATRTSTHPESAAGLLVQRAIAFIQANARYGISVEDVREHLGVSRALMDLRFREIRGESVLSVLTEARLAELKRALTASDETIGEITARLGWKSPNYPKNLFKKRLGCSMLVWRKMHRTNN